MARYVKKRYWREKKTSYKGISYIVNHYELDDGMTVTSLEDFKPGDRVEVYYDESWGMAKMKYAMTRERLKEFVYYEDGCLKWLDGTRAGHKKNEEIGYITSKGYKAVLVDGKKHLVHRLIWLWHYGEFPKETIDHINHDKLDNRIENLREVSNAENHKNMGRVKGNNPYNNVYYSKQKKKWYVRVGADATYYGIFDTVEEAISMALTARDSLGYHDNHGE